MKKIRSTVSSWRAHFALPSWLRGTALALSLSALGAALVQAANVEEVFSFLDSPTRVLSLVEGADGAIYGVSDGGTPETSVSSIVPLSYGLLFRLDSDGKATVVHRFDGSVGRGPSFLTRGADHVLYGLTNDNWPAQTQPNCTIFRVGLGGSAELRYQFPQGTVPIELVGDAAGGVIVTIRHFGGFSPVADTVYRLAPEGSFGSYAQISGGLSQLVLDSTGNLYGTTFTGYLSNGAATGVAQIVKVSTGGGGATVVKSFDNLTRLSGLVLGADGNIYGSYAELTTSHPSAVFRLTPTGSYTEIFTGQGSAPKVLRQTSSGVDFLRGVAFERVDPDGNLIELGQLADSGYTQNVLLAASNGKCYATSIALDFGSTILAINQIDLSGKVTPFATNLTGEGDLLSGGLALGHDGQLYGTTYTGGSTMRGTIFRFDTAANQPADVHVLSVSEGQRPVGALVPDATGHLQGLMDPAPGHTSGTNAGGIFSYSPSGSFTRRYNFPLPKYGWGDQPTDNGAQMALADDGTLYGRVQHEARALQFLFRLDSDNTYQELTDLGLVSEIGDFVSDGNGGLAFPILTTKTRGVYHILASGKLVKTNFPASSFPSGRFALGDDGLFYGMASDSASYFFAGESHFGVDAFRYSQSLSQFDPARASFRLIRALPQLAPSSSEGAGAVGLVKASDGFFYGLRLIDNGLEQIFVTNKAGGFRVLGQIRTAVSGFMEQANLTEGSDGFLYGAFTRGGKWGGGMIYKVTKIAPGNTAPVAQDDQLKFAGSGPSALDVLANDMDADNDVPYITAVTQGASGTVTIAPGAFAVTYTPKKKSAAPDTFTYTISDGFGGTSTATVTVTNPFVATAGDYSIQLLDDTTHQPHGTLRGTLGTDGNFTYNISFDDNAYTLKGTLAVDFNGDLAPIFVFPDKTRINLALHFSAAAYGSLTASLTHSTEKLTGQGAAAATTIPTGTSAGNFTLSLPSTADGVTAPAGTGYATVALSKTGGVKIVGKLPDGTAFSAGIPIQADGHAAFLLPLYAKPKGYAYGDLLFRNGTVVDGTVTVHKPAQDKPGKLLYPDGFDLVLQASGGSFADPEKGLSALHGGASPVDYQFTATLDQQKTPFSVHFSVDSADKLPSSPLAGKLALKFDRKTGAVTGSFVDPATGAKRALGGIIRQSNHTAEGLFLDESHAWPFVLQAAGP